MGDSQPDSAPGAGQRRRYYFTSKRKAEDFAKLSDLPKSQIKVL